MAQVILLGTGSAWSGPDRENTYMLVRGSETDILIDCAGSPAQRLARVGADPAKIAHVILTHDHPDHIYGFPIFMLNAWMAGRRAPMHIYGLEQTLEAARLMLKAVRASLWPDFFPVEYHVVEPQSISELPPIGEFDISANLGSHFVSTIALRVTDRTRNATFCYSADTSPNANIVQLARQAKYLFHEATMLDQSGEGHSTAVEAGQIAAEAEVSELVLLHLPPTVEPARWKAAAESTFSGPVTVAKDFDSFEF